jgi:hypothetical protein
MHVNHVENYVEMIKKRAELQDFRKGSGCEMIKKRNELPDFRKGSGN